MYRPISLPSTPGIVRLALITPSTGGRPAINASNTASKPASAAAENSSKAARGASAPIGGGAPILSSPNGARAATIRGLDRIGDRWPGRARDVRAGPGGRRQFGRRLQQTPLSSRLLS